jgi:HPt (histidine-containing phosphotransfer) domain-containing protein
MNMPIAGEGEHSRESMAMTPEQIESSDPFGPVLNLAVARRRLGGDEDLLRDLAGFFIEDAPRLLDSTRNALMNNDLETATRFAHSLKGLASNFEAVSTVELAQELETSMRTGRAEDATRLLGPLGQEIQRVVDSLHAQVLK